MRDECFEGEPVMHVHILCVFFFHLLFSSSFPIKQMRCVSRYDPGQIKDSTFMTRPRIVYLWNFTGILHLSMQLSLLKIVVPLYI